MRQIAIAAGAACLAVLGANMPAGAAPDNYVYLNNDADRAARVTVYRDRGAVVGTYCVPAGQSGKTWSGVRVRAVRVDVMQRGCRGALLFEREMAVRALGSPATSVFEVKRIGRGYTLVER